jgi:hypothetical protein
MHRQAPMRRDCTGTGTAIDNPSNDDDDNSA